MTAAQLLHTIEGYVLALIIGLSAVLGPCVVLMLAYALGEHRRRRYVGRHRYPHRYSDDDGGTGWLVGMGEAAA